MEKQGEHDLRIFTDGCHEPKSGRGGWAFVVYRGTVEIASACGGIDKSASNAAELIALLEATNWIDRNAGDENAVIRSDSNYAVEGCNRWRHIWKGNGWKTINANPNARKRAIPNADLWKAIDLRLSGNNRITIAWCKGHSGIPGNERADALANEGRLSPGNA